VILIQRRSDWQDFTTHTYIFCSYQCNEIIFKLNNFLLSKNYFYEVVKKRFKHLLLYRKKDCRHGNFQRDADLIKTLQKVV